MIVVDHLPAETLGDGDLAFLGALRRHHGAVATIIENEDALHLDPHLHVADAVLLTPDLRHLLLVGAATTPRAGVGAGAQYADARCPPLEAHLRAEDATPHGDRHHHHLEGNVISRLDLPRLVRPHHRRLNVPAVPVPRVPCRKVRIEVRYGKFFSTKKKYGEDGLVLVQKENTIKYRHVSFRASSGKAEAG
jgi:hypothetical protein